MKLSRMSDETLRKKFYTFWKLLIWEKVIVPHAQQKAMWNYYGAIIEERDRRCHIRFNYQVTAKMLAEYNGQRSYEDYIISRGFVLRKWGTSCQKAGKNCYCQAL
jgi:hypothetical protein